MIMAKRDVKNWKTGETVVSEGEEVDETIVDQLVAIEPPPMENREAWDLHREVFFVLMRVAISE